ncbi:MAG: GAF domain-containing protein [Coleofasciculus sp. S288]|nr:GAF domain-containing protein [Coleofasciculus sp. S288]
MPIAGEPRFSRTLPLRTFDRLHESLQQMKSFLGEEATVLTEEVLCKGAISSEYQAQRFTVVVSKRFSALLLGTPQESLSFAEFDSKPGLYQVGLSFDSKAIASFLTQFADQLENHSVVLHWLNLTQTSQLSNDAAIQSEFTLSLLDILSSHTTNGFVHPDTPYSDAAVCQPVVEEALHQQVEQERLLHQVTTQIRQSLELPVILNTAVEQVRHFLQVDRLVIYQFDFNGISTSSKRDIPVAEVKGDALALPVASSNGNISSEQLSLVALERCRGCVTYEARASEAISSVLNLTEERDCSIHVPNCREKYHQGQTFAVDDVETTYIASPCILGLLRQTQVRAKLVVPIVVQDKLWGLLIAHQCFEPRQWKNSEKTFLTQIAEHLSVAIYQARLYAQLQQQKTTLEQKVIERTQELRDTLQAAQAANCAKSEFIAAMSHELRTPLTCVIGMSATLLRWSYGQEGAKAVPLDKQRRYLKTIQESGEHLLELINDILDFSQVEAGKAALNISEFSLSKLTHQTLNALQEKAALQGVELDMELQVKPQSDRFFADQRRVKQILFNLLGNAVKFTPTGGSVTLRVWRENNLAVFQIEDTGIGIPEDQLPLLFQKFQQLETTYHRSYEGTGLGLALTKQLVELHGGRIEVESVSGEGSLFTVWLPAQPPTAANSARGTATRSPNSQPQGSIVLLEAKEESATPICEILTAAGYQIVWLIDGSTAIDQIKLLQPKAVIVDWQLPGIGGYEVTYCLRSSPATQHIKILALTTSSLAQDPDDHLSGGVDDYLPKPVEPMQLLNKVTTLMTN